jgi:molybdopterin converting factor small subunit
MAIVRLFAGLRDAAGVSRVELDGDTVDQVIAAAVERFGPSFESGLTRARVWVNGEEADGTQQIGAADELALLPPVSGGAGTVQAPAGINPGSLLLGLIAVGMIVANVMGTEAWVAAAVVGALALWAADLGSTVAARGHDLPVIPVLATTLAAMAGTRLLGSEGMAVAAGVAVIAPMVWGVISESSRPLTSIAPSVLVSALAGLATASLLDVRFSYDATVFGVFLAVAVAATIAGALTERLRNLPFGDPFTISAIVAIATSVIAAAVWDLSLATYLFVGVVLAAGLVAGRTLGSIVRTGSGSLVDRPPGVGYPADGVVVAAALFMPILALLA